MSQPLHTWNSVEFLQLFQADRLGGGMNHSDRNYPAYLHKGFPACPAFLSLNKTYRRRGYPLKLRFSPSEGLGLDLESSKKMSHAVQVVCISRNQFQNTPKAGAKLTPAMCRKHLTRKPGALGVFQGKTRKPKPFPVTLIKGQHV